ncbi:MAG: hypothetical protein ACOC6B_07350 [Thermodesulfobacteriota bacterium]
MTYTRSTKEQISRWLWLWIPALIFVAPGILKAASPFLYSLTKGETGIIENLTAVVLFLAVVYGIRSFRSRSELPVRWLGVWIAMVTVAALVFLGEEISWGQHYFHWETPEQWSHINLQNETNLHNLNKLVNHIPRFILSMAAFVGGIVVPIVIRAKRISLNPAAPYYWLWPTIVCTPTSIMALTIGIPDKIGYELDLALWEFLTFYPGELKECFLAIFLFLYTLSFYRRLQQRAQR